MEWGQNIAMGDDPGQSLPRFTARQGGHGVHRFSACDLRGGQVRTGTVQQIRRRTIGGEPVGMEIHSLLINGRTRTSSTRKSRI